MVDVDLSIKDNPTLGRAANGVFLDVLEAQAIENRAAVVEGREPRIAKRENSYPGYEAQENSEDSDVTFGSSYRDGSAVVPVDPDVVNPIPQSNGVKK